MSQANISNTADAQHPVVIAALYKFVALDDFETVQPALLTFCNGHDIKGTLLLAREGINGTVAASREAIDALLAHLKQDPRLAELEHKESYADIVPFYRMKVRLKKEIVTIGDQAVDPTSTVGTYVKPENWNALIEDPEVLLIDTRNDYEVEVGTFKNAVDPHTTSFREFPEYVRENLDKGKHKKVAMFCTGGIRCEKASSFMLNEGFEEVFHLEGGILKYLEEVPVEEQLWEGECFVFDNRVTVDKRLNQGSYDMCHACRHPLTEVEKQSPQYIPGESCPKCHEKLTDEQRASFKERQRQIELAKKRGEQHIGVPQDN